VLNAPTPNETIEYLKECIDIPIVITVVSEKTDIEGRLNSGVSILNVSAASRTPEIVRRIRNEYPTVPIIATGGPTPDSILRTIEAGANAITYTPPASGEIFKNLMNKYRAEH
jgi:2-keto-3-deoxy-6-phosphogluconate aldolase